MVVAERDGPPRERGTLEATHRRAIDLTGGRWTRLRESAWKVAAAAGLASTAGYFVLPGEPAKDIAYLAIGLVSTAWIVAAIRLHKPAEHVAWYLLAAGNLCSVLADGIENIGYNLVLHRSVPYPSVADGFYLLSYPFIFAGVVRLTGARRRAVRREDYADAAILSIGALALSWHFLMGSYLSDSTMGTFGKLVEIAYPMMDLAILFILVRAIAFGVERRPFHNILVTALASMLIADFIYDVLVLHGRYAIGNAVDAGWLLNYVLMGVAALHPSMSTQPAEVSVPPVTSRRIPVIALACLIAPGIQLVGTLAGASTNVPVLAGASIALFVLVALRMSWLFHRVRAQAVRAEADASALQEALRARDTLEADLRYQAFHDTLTGLANRDLLHDRVAHALSAATRSGRALALCFCDLDGFKTVNDSLGHHSGDRLLSVAATRLRYVVRPGDTVARLGGDEFAVLMPDLESPDAATAVAERILGVLRQPIEVGGRAINLSASVGMAFGDPAKGAEQLLREADAAMYEAKGKGKGRWAIFETAMHARSVERLELINAFRPSLEREDFFLHYQPYFSLAGGHLEGFEALARWQHPSLDLVGPHRFIPLAEETGFIVQLGRWVLETACEQAARWFDGRRGLTMSVNLSGRQLQNAHLCDDVRMALAVSGLRPECLLLEFTESTLMTDSDDNARILRELKAIGVKLGLDDFGTGYSSLGYLQRFPLDVIKIDKSFVDPLADPHSEGTALVATIIRFARDLGLRTVAEGIEHPSQRVALAGLGCDSAQGFLMAKPLDPRQASELLTNNPLAAIKD